MTRVSLSLLSMFGCASRSACTSPRGQVFILVLGNACLSRTRQAIITVECKAGDIDSAVDKADDAGAEVEAVKYMFSSRKVLAAYACRW